MPFAKQEASLVLVELYKCYSVMLFLLVYLASMVLLHFGEQFAQPIKQNIIYNYQSEYKCDINE